MADPEDVNFEHEGVEFNYRYKKGILFDSDFMEPSQGDLPEIYAALNEQLKVQDGNLSTDDAIAQASLSKGKKNKARSNTLIEMVLSRAPHNKAAFAMHIANLRTKPIKALEEFENYITSGGKPNPAIYTSVGAAHLDLGDIILARKFADRAHSMSGGGSRFTMHLYQAIKKEKERIDRRGE